jgi:DNA-binding transcriptional LysR family regulator
MLNLFHARYFVDTIRLGSMKAASQKNFVTLSAVSQGIRALEVSLSLPLHHHENGFY